MEYEYFSSINDVQQLHDFLQEKKLTHQKYCHYSSISIVNKILENQFFHLSEIQSVNDKKESNFDNEFFLCFSATDSENIPMWYLYGGIDGKGARITFRKTVMKKWLSEITNNPSFYVVKYTDEGLNIITEIKPLEIGKDIVSVNCSDVLYISNYDEDSNLRIKYNNHSNYAFPKAKYGELCQQFHGANKALPWFYEKEFRVIVTVSAQLSEMIQADSKLVKLAVSFSDDIISEIEIMTGPEQIDDVDTTKLKGFSKYMQRTIKKSRYKGEINMGLRGKLCRDCKKL